MKNHATWRVHSILLPSRHWNGRSPTVRRALSTAKHWFSGRASICSSSGLMVCIKCQKPSKPSKPWLSVQNGKHTYIVLANPLWRLCFFWELKSQNSCGSPMRLVMTKGLGESSLVCFNAMAMIPAYSITHYRSFFNILGHLRLVLGLNNQIESPKVFARGRTYEVSKAYISSLSWAVARYAAVLLEYPRSPASAETPLEQLEEHLSKAADHSNFKAWISRDGVWQGESITPAKIRWPIGCSSHQNRILRKLLWSSGYPEDCISKPLLKAIRIIRTCSTQLVEAQVFTPRKQVWSRLFSRPFLSESPSGDSQTLLFQFPLSQRSHRFI